MNIKERVRETETERQRETERDRDPSAAEPQNGALMRAVCAVAGLCFPRTSKHFGNFICVIFLSLFLILVKCRKIAARERHMACLVLQATTRCACVRTCACSLGINSRYQKHSFFNAKT